MEWGPVPKAPSAPSGPTDTAARHKEEGNDRFKRGEFKDALASYRLALQALKGSATAPATEMRLACHLNIAAVLLKSHRPLEAVAACTDALVLDARNVKALFRRGKARFALGELDAALDDLDRALAVQPEPRPLVSRPRAQ